MENGHSSSTSSAETTAALQERVYSLNEEVRNLRVEMAERSRPQWQVLLGVFSLTTMVLGGAGSLALAPVRDMVVRLDRDIRDISAQIVSRGEHAERWRRGEAEDLALQRQIDDVRKNFGATDSLRDALVDLKARLEHVERKE